MVSLAPKVLQTLLALIRRAGTVVSKADELDAATGKPVTALTLGGNYG